MEKDDLSTLRPFADWHEDFGPCLWYQIDTEKAEPIGQPPYVGSPLDSDWPPWGDDAGVWMWTPLPPWPKMP